MGVMIILDVAIMIILLYGYDVKDKGIMRIKDVAIMIIIKDSVMAMLKIRI